MCWILGIFFLLKLSPRLLETRDFYLSGWGVGKEEEYVLVCFPFPGETWMSPALGDPSQQGCSVGVPGCRRSAESRGCGRRRRPFFAPAAEVAPLPAAASTQGRGPAA